MPTKLSIVTALALALALSSAVTADAPKLLPRGPQAIPRQYIVILNDDFIGVRDHGIEVKGRPERRARMETALSDLKGLYSFRPQTLWVDAVRGFTMTATREEALRIARDPSVLFVEEDARSSQLQMSSTPSCDKTCTEEQSLPLNTRPFPTSPQAITCSNPDPGSLANCIDNWGLDRTDQTILPRDGVYAFANNGTGVRVYMVDAGVLATHRELAGKVGEGFNAACGDCNLSQLLCNDHGTAVTSIVAGNTYGVARGVTIHPVQVFRTCSPTEQPPHACVGTCCNPNGQDPRVLSPSVSTYVSAFNWIVQHHASHPGPAVANLSGANDPVFVGSLSFITAVRSVITNGISFVQAAGNQNSNACNYSVHQADPGYNVADAIVAAGYTELAVDGPLRNGRWSESSFLGSNYGSCVDIWAPAQWTIGAGRWYDAYNPPAGYCWLSGTSMAAPHVTGAIARYLQNHPTATPQQVKSALLSGAMLNVLQTSGANSIGAGSPNRLLQFVP